MIDFGFADGEYSGSYITFLGTMVGAVVEQTNSLLYKNYLAVPLRFENSIVFGSFQYKTSSRQFEKFRKQRGCFFSLEWHKA